MKINHNAAIDQLKLIFGLQKHKIRIQTRKIKIFLYFFFLVNLVRAVFQLNFECKMSNLRILCFEICSTSVSTSYFSSLCVCM